MNIKKIIEEKGGIFIETKNYYTTFLCENGHKTRKRNDSFKKTWCNECQNNTIEDCHKLAKQRNFKFLSEKYINCKKLYEWQCSEGHQWKAKYSNIKTGKGCPECLRVPYKWFVDYCKKKKGKLLTTEDKYKQVIQKMKVQCVEGHIFEPWGGALRKGSWCSKCQENISERTCRKILEYIYKKPFRKQRPEWLWNPETDQFLELDGYNEELGIAFEYNGSQHYKRSEYFDKNEENFIKRQERDHYKQEICKHNDILLISIPYILKYEEIYQFIIKHLPNNENIPEILDYNELNIISYNQNKIQEINEYIKEKYQGQLISTNYVNNTTKLDFKCENGHIFKSTWGTILGDSFCKECTYQPMRQKMKRIVEDFCLKNSLKLISDYKNAKTKLKFDCLKCSNHFNCTWDNMRTKKVFCC